MDSITGSWTFTRKVPGSGILCPSGPQPTAHPQQLKTNKGKILTHLRESTFLSKSMSSSTWCPGRVTTSNIFTATFSCNFLAMALLVLFSPFPHFPFLSIARSFQSLAGVAEYLTVSYYVFWQNVQPVFQVNVCFCLLKPLNKWLMTLCYIEDSIKW